MAPASCGLVCPLQGQAALGSPAGVRWGGFRGWLWCVESLEEPRQRSVRRACVGRGVAGSDARGVWPRDSGLAQARAAQNGPFLALRAGRDADTGRRPRLLPPRWGILLLRPPERSLVTGDRTPTGGGGCSRPRPQGLWQCSAPTVCAVKLRRSPVPGAATRGQQTVGAVTAGEGPGPAGSTLLGAVLWEAAGCNFQLTLSVKSTSVPSLTAPQCAVQPAAAWASLGTASRCGRWAPRQPCWVDAGHGAATSAFPPAPSGPTHSRLSGTSWTRSSPVRKAARPCGTASLCGVRPRLWAPPQHRPLSVSGLIVSSDPAEAASGREILGSSPSLIPGLLPTCRHSCVPLRERSAVFAGVARPSL